MEEKKKTNNDYRIGNYLQDQNGKIYQVCNIDRFDIVAISLDSNAEDFITSLERKPIDITDDWLTKLGIPKKNARHFDIGGIEIYIRWYGSGDGEACFFTPSPMYAAPCQYVHELQNLYYALTKKELTIKE